MTTRAMFSKRSHSSKAIELQVPPGIYLSGTTITGQVNINLRLVHEEDIDAAEVRLYGYANTCYDSRVLVRETTTLWTRGSSIYPLPGSDILSMPFSFTLPDKLPPSFQVQGLEYSATVRYSLTAVGLSRQGLLNVNKQHCVPLTVVPKDDFGTSLIQGWVAQGWQTFSKEERIRKGLWGEYSTVFVQLDLPNRILPLSSTLPYVITITTTSSPLTRTQAATHPPAFPLMPTSADALHFTLGRRLVICAPHNSTRSYKEIEAFLGPKATTAVTGKARPLVRGSIDNGKWVPHDGHSVSTDESDRRMGAWVQRVVFESTFTLDCSPSFALPGLIECAYEFVVTVPFPGLRNDVRLAVPVTVTSGIWTTGSQDVPPPGVATSEVLPLDIPPAYWDMNYPGRLNDDEKSGN
ncbi:uncharacterized protein BXZ73DRAFT_99606 [Epithele typhae]|uniref:uncharacterized protein n=1 Tax=Epithele typhae TaxID=378194 RepID=UPI00200827E5|nr:uncharacterized protein BXZ73DRAFT_99606 [Epithele typhae]KAH9939401.1 hypothetical protein BXZ73DRAFT_99606 [Epithele typhae]